MCTRLDHRLAVFASLLLAACSSAQKKTTPELSKLEGAKVALVDIDGEKESRAVVEAALVNQLLRRGTFYLVSSGDVEAAKVSPEINSADPIAVARKAGADYALTAKVIQFETSEKDGYKTEEVEDSQLEQETGNGKTERTYKTASMEGHVQVKLFFAPTKLGDKDVRSALAIADDRVDADSRSSAIHLPPKLSYLEMLANRAFQAFFDAYR